MQYFRNDLLYNNSREQYIRDDQREVDSGKSKGTSTSVAIHRTLQIGGPVEGREVDHEGETKDKDVPVDSPSLVSSKDYGRLRHFNWKWLINKYLFQNKTKSGLAHSSKMKRINPWYVGYVSLE